MNLTHLMSIMVTEGNFEYDKKNYEVLVYVLFCFHQGGDLIYWSVIFLFFQQVQQQRLIAQNNI